MTTEAVTDDFLRALPKAELHVHLEGTMDPELRIALAERNGLTIPEASAEEVRAGYDFDDLASFLAVYYANMDVLRTERDFFDLALAYLRRAASEGVVHAELFFDPQSHTSRGVPFPAVIRGYRQAVLEARRELGISAELILCFLRDYGAPHAMSTLMEALPYKDWIIGVGLDSDERGNPPAKYAEVFARARQEGFLLTVHCDVDQEGSIEHLRQAIEDLRVDRIDHGTNVVESPELVAAVRDRRIGLTSCPLSNTLVSDGMKSREVLELLDAGVLISINSDDPPYFGGYILDNYRAFAAETGADRALMTRLARNSIETAWVSASRRQRMLEALAEI